MKRLLLIITLIGLCIVNTNAQKRVPDVHKTCNEQIYRRTEIILPQVKGYNCYKADLHIHTIYSDGEITPRQRVREAWYDGLDIIAITDHLEARNYEKYILRAHAPHNPDGKAHKYYHAGSVRLMEDGTDPGIRCDLNATFAEAQEYVKKEGYPILLIKGCEISRSPFEQGHFNALFLTDIQGIYNIDTKETFRNVHKQGGIVIHNHPGYRRKTTEKSDWQAEVYKEGLFDGVEVVNGTTFYPKMIRRCIDEKLIMIGGTDSHRPTSGQYKDLGFFRTMTLILAKENTEKAIKDALLKRRTLVYSGGDLMGEEEWLSEFLNAAIDCRMIDENKEKGTRTYIFTNTSSLTYRFRRGKTILHLRPFESLRFVFGKDKKTDKFNTPKLLVENMWIADYKHPIIEFTTDK